MKSWFLCSWIIGSLLLIAAAALPQQSKPGLGLKLTAHSAMLTWTAPTPATGLTGYNVYSAPCTGTFTPTPGQTSTTALVGTCSAAGAFTVIAPNVSPVLSTYTDTTPVPGKTIVYRLTSLCASCATVESVPSNQVSASWPAVASSQLVITSAQKTITGNKETITVAWTENVSGFSVPETAYQIWGNGKILRVNVCFLASCSATWTGTTVNAPWITVSDGSGNVATKAI